VYVWKLTLWRDSSGGEEMARELMVDTGLSAQELVHDAHVAASTAGAATVAARVAVTGIEVRTGRPPAATAADIAEAVMGSEAWTTYKNTESKSLHGPRKPQGKNAVEKRTKERRSKLGTTLAGWTLQNPPEHFAGTDTRWTMDQPLMWLPPDGDVNHMHIETLGNMISEAFHQHKVKMNTEAKRVKKSSTAAEASAWQADTRVHGANFFIPKK